MSAGSRKWIPGSDPKDLDPGSVRIIDPTLTVCDRIHWDHSFLLRNKARDPFEVPDLKLTCLMAGSIGIRYPTKETHVYFISFLTAGTNSISH